MFLIGGIEGLPKSDLEPAVVFISSIDGPPSDKKLNILDSSFFLVSTLMFFLKPKDAVRFDILISLAAVS